MGAKMFMLPLKVETELGDEKAGSQSRLVPRDQVTPKCAV